MADTKISAMTAATDLSGAEFAGIQSATNKRFGISLFAADATAQEAASSNVVFVTPGIQHRHPSAAKFWALVAANGSALTVNYNVSGITDTGVGDLTVTIGTDFSSANWCPLTGNNTTSANASTSTSRRLLDIGTVAAGSIQLQCRDGAGTVKDPDTPYSVGGFGDQ